MFPLFDTERAFRQVSRLCLGAGVALSGTRIKDLQDGYLNFLEQYHSHLPVNRSGDPFVDDCSTYVSLWELKQEKEFGKPLIPLTPQDYEVCQKGRKLAAATFPGFLSLDEDLATLFQLVVHSIFVRQTESRKALEGALSGSNRETLGTFWMAPGRLKRDEDFYEIYVHELVHQLLFIEDMVQPQFDYQETLRTKNFALSPLRDRAMPFDRAVHGAIIAGAILWLRSEFLPHINDSVVHGNSGHINRQMQAAIQQIQVLDEERDLLGPGLRNLLEWCSGFGGSLSTNGEMQPKTGPSQRTGSH